MTLLEVSASLSLSVAETSDEPSTVIAAATGKSDAASLIAFLTEKTVLQDVVAAQLRRVLGAQYSFEMCCKQFLIINYSSSPIIWGVFLFSAKRRYPCYDLFTLATLYCI